jgi:predicted GNAT family acetyltransferase
VTDSAAGSVDIRDNEAAGRYEALLDGAVAGYVEYRDRGERRILVHTEVDPAFGGRGIGTRLAAASLDDARNHGRPVVPRCPFIRSYLERHPEYADVVAGSRTSP